MGCYHFRKTSQTAINLKARPLNLKPFKGTTWDLTEFHTFFIVFTVGFEQMFYEVHLV